MQDGEIIPEKDNTGERAAQTLRNLEKRSEDAFDLLNASIEDLMRRINASSDDEQSK